MPAGHCAVYHRHRHVHHRQVQIDGIRCALLSDPWSAKITRLHNDTDMMALGGGSFVGENLALEIVDVWLGTGLLAGSAPSAPEFDKVMALEK